MLVPPGRGVEGRLRDIVRHLNSKETVEVRSGMCWICSYTVSEIQNCRTVSRGAGLSFRRYVCKLGTESRG